MSEIEKIGDFIYFYDEDTTVVAYKATTFQSEALQMIEKKLEGIAQKTGEIQEIVYNGDTYIGMAFETISELQLIVTLAQ